jgi:iron complex transport system permease protein
MVVMPNASSSSRPPRLPLLPAGGRRALLLLGGAALISLLAALAIGSVALPLAEVLAWLRGQDAPLVASVLELRLPRALTAFAVGALLALAGALLQALLRNPLADPYVLGVSGGAAVAALGALALGASMLVMQAAAALGALATLVLLFALAQRAFFTRDALHGEQATSVVLLTGVMIAAFASAVLSVILTLASDAQLRTMVFWLLGDLGSATSLVHALGSLAILLASLLLALQRAPALNLLLRGDVQAFTQGVDVERTRRVLVVIAAIAAGTVVTQAGAVGFVGFVAPHLARLVLGNDQRLLLPASTLAGGTLVVLADLVARSAFAPVQLPVGVVTALFGVPVFLYLLRRR